MLGDMKNRWMDHRVWSIKQAMNFIVIVLLACISDTRRQAIAVRAAFGKVMARKWAKVPVYDAA